MMMIVIMMTTNIAQIANVITILRDESLISFTTSSFVRPSFRLPPFHVLILLFSNPPARGNGGGIISTSEWGGGTDIHLLTSHLLQLFSQLTVREMLHYCEI